MRLALYALSMVPDGTLRDQVELARIAEDLGYDDLALGEHVVMADKLPPWVRGGTFPHNAAERFIEPMAAFAAMSMITTRIRFVGCIIIAPLRPAALLAKQAATIHELSNGRLVLGVSVSWLDKEYEALGVRFDQRGDRLDDLVGAVRELWSHEPAAFHSRSVNFDGMYCKPRPQHVDDIPFWFGGQFTPRLVRRIADWGQGYLPHQAAGMSWEDLGQQVTKVKAAMQAVGRDPGKLEVSVRFPISGKPFAEALAEDRPRMEAAGISQVYCPVTRPRTLAEARPVIEDIARAWHAYRA
ncbi:MAG: TIGR03619 family F420-dependent LLM class oxidoreductase [Chloroflexi bacterium]|nr:TIGR03619 family F420-dependent LLM class oxidoreductase [Chloroflexota bacterium]